MDGNNGTMVTEFILVGFRDHPELQIPLFLVFLLIYATTVLGNLGMIVLIQMDSHLHLTMYFFLTGLSFVDICYSSSIAPRALVNFFEWGETISVAGCAGQLFFFAGFASTESFLLAAMAYDRYVAICNPLLYETVISRRVCAGLVAGSYLAGFANATLLTSCTFQLTFCGPNVIHHYFCNVLPLLQLSCSDTRINEILLSTGAGLIQISTVMTLLSSYLRILIAILKIRSPEGRRKAFSTCSSHLVAVAIFYGTTFFIYLRPDSSSSLDEDRVLSIFYTLVIPMLNPLIYSLRNREVKDALRNAMERRNRYLIPILQMKKLRCLKQG
ncbi:olfactory receptor 1009-like [Ornithorhynchus anatinus]|uniref:olfactory receptor 1009-like n=1 Tax=Ornithorhynchus anatinus TaxID=9258 RepID=UPI0010A93A76|nr:olfactory receptor 1009-like [Ornithorhynchus anatinus]